MNLEAYKRILALANNPQVILRAADQQKAVDPTQSTQGGPPGAPGASMAQNQIPQAGPAQSGQQPAINPEALQKVADGILFPGGKPTQPAARPEVENASPSLSQHLRNRRASQQNNPTMTQPGRLTLGGF